VWLVIALLLGFGVLGVLLSGSHRELSLDAAERTVLLLAVGLVAGIGLVVRRLRPQAVAAATLVVLAVLPWNGADGALLLAVVAAAGLAALVTDALARGRPEERPHPLVRVAVVVPAVVVTVVGGLFLPVAAGGLPHRELAGWITGPASTGGTVAVPINLWGDLLRDGVPDDRLVLTAAPDAAAATWTVAVGDDGGVSGAAAGFGTGAAALTVRPLPPAEMRDGVAEPRSGEPQDGRSAAGTAILARQRLGSLLAASPRLHAGPDVVTALRNGSVDARVLVVLAGLTVQHTVEVAALPVVSGEDPQSVPRHEVVVARLDGSSADRPEVVAALTELLQGQSVPFAPAAVTPGPSGVTVGWPPPERASGVGP
jgi:putative peptide zinc metalloprotease protein